MHEWALAEAIISTALEASEKEKFEEITEIDIKMGELQQIEEEIFEFALKELMKERASLKKTKINIKIMETTFRCNACGHKWSFNDIKEKLNEEEVESIHFIPEVAFVHSRCPKCKSPDFEIIEGRGVWIDSIKGLR